MTIPINTNFNTHS